MIEYQFNLERSPIDPRDFTLESIYPVTVELPEEWDLRKDMPEVRDQGQQGTCSAQTAAAMKEWQEKIDVGYSGYMSPQFVYNLRTNQEGSGMTPRDTMQILNKIGIVKETDFQYGNMARPGDDLILKALRYQISGYAMINTLDSLKKALYANGPCYVAFPVFNANNMQFWRQEFSTQQSLGGHAVTCAGYLKDCFIIRNSWSTAWGDRGYTYYPFSDFGHHWELWTTIDADSNPETLINLVNRRKPTREERKGFLRNLFAKKLKK